MVVILIVIVVVVVVVVVVYRCYGFLSHASESYVMSADILIFTQHLFPLVAARVVADANLNKVCSILLCQSNLMLLCNNKITVGSDLMISVVCLLGFLLI